MSEITEGPETAPVSLNLRIVESKAVHGDAVFIGPQDVFDKARRGDELTLDDARRCGVIQIIDDPVRELTPEEKAIRTQKFNEWGGIIKWDKP